MIAAVALVSLFLSPLSDCSIVAPETFTNPGALTGSMSVCITAPSFCGVTYAFESLPAGAPVRLLSRIDVPGADITQPIAFPANAGAGVPSDFGFTSASGRPFPAADRREIARYAYSHAGAPGITYTFRLRSDSIVSIGKRITDCQHLDLDGPQFVEVPADGKLPAPSVQGIRR